MRDKPFSSSRIIDIEDIELDVYFTFEPAQQALRDPGGNFVQPPEPASISISGIYVVGGNLFDFSIDVDIFDSDIEEKVLLTLSEEDD